MLMIESIKDGGMVGQGGKVAGKAGWGFEGGRKERFFR